MTGLRAIGLGVALATAFVGGCDWLSDKPKESATAEPTPTLRLALITDLKGYLEPCGCTSRPLGGIDRMAAKIKALRAEGVPLVTVAAGDTLFDGVDYGEGGEEQQLRKAETLVQVLNGLGVDAVLPGPHDLEHPGLANLREASRFKWLANADGVVRADLNIVLANGDRREINRIARANEGIDFIVQGALDEDAPVPPRKVGEAWALHASRQGQGLTVVDIYRRSVGPYEDRSLWSRLAKREALDLEIDALTNKIAEWKASSVAADDLKVQERRLARMREERATLDTPPSLANGNVFVATWHELPPEAPSDPEVKALVLEHDKAVNAYNKKALVDLKPPAVQKGQASFVGSKACAAACHVPAYQWWLTTEHGHAYQTLVDRHKEYSLSCVGCHVTGYNQPGGSTVTHNLGGALVNVGCESCHGAGSLHTADPTVPIRRDTEPALCVGCHNTEHSDLFDYEAYRARMIVPGHGLPVTANREPQAANR